jgi:hypothetical protein
VTYQTQHLHATSIKLILQLCECAELRGAHRGVISRVREQHDPRVADELVEIDVALCSLCMEVGRCSIQSVRHSLSSRSSYIPTDPSLNRGCSAGSVSPRLNRGAAGRWKLSVGRAAERRAREAARGRNEAILMSVRRILKW